MKANRQQIVQTLQLLASSDEQLAYQKSVPIADVSAELFCLWDGVFSHHHDLSDFSAEEQASLRAFHDIFERVSRLLPHTPLPPIHEFVRSPHWLQLSRAASRTLQFFVHAPHEPTAKGKPRDARLR